MNNFSEQKAMTTDFGLFEKIKEEHTLAPGVPSTPPSPDAP